MYLETFYLPIDREEEMIEKKLKEKRGFLDDLYPCGIFDKNEFREINFSAITIFYGGNGSGKSTLLNLIAQKLVLNRIAPFNSGEFFNDYIAACSYALGYDDEGFRLRIPNGSRIITSDDIFDYMLAVRSNNEDIGEHAEDAKEKWAELRFGDTVKFSGPEDYEALRLQVQARRKTLSRRKFIRQEVGKKIQLGSNGETALSYFHKKLKDDTLYCLDEPENSLSPKMQLKLAEILETTARYFGCQFIIATHSPFLLAMEGARIYDLDATPVDIKNWWELENTKTYYEFFKSHKHRFE